VDYRNDCHDHAIHHRMNHSNDLVVHSTIHDDVMANSDDDRVRDFDDDDEANVTGVGVIVICPFLFLFLVFWWTFVVVGILSICQILLMRNDFLVHSPLVTDWVFWISLCDVSFRAIFVTNALDDVLAMDCALCDVSFRAIGVSLCDASSRVFWISLCDVSFRAIFVGNALDDALAMDCDLYGDCCLLATMSVRVVVSPFVSTVID